MSFLDDATYIVLDKSNENSHIDLCIWLHDLLLEISTI